MKEFDLTNLSGKKTICIKLRIISFLFFVIAIVPLGVVAAKGFEIAPLLATSAWLIISGGLGFYCLSISKKALTLPDKLRIEDHEITLQKGDVSNSYKIKQISDLCLSFIISKSIGYEIIFAYKKLNVITCVISTDRAQLGNIFDALVLAVGEEKVHQVSDGLPDELANQDGDI